MVTGSGAERKGTFKTFAEVDLKQFLQMIYTLKMQVRLITSEPRLPLCAKCLSGNPGHLPFSRHCNKAQGILTSFSVDKSRFSDLVLYFVGHPQLILSEWRSVAKFTSSPVIPEVVCSFPGQTHSSCGFDSLSDPFLM
jgi:hypothetical protein